jgi:hypothetical protein
LTELCFEVLKVTDTSLVLCVYFSLFILAISCLHRRVLQKNISHFRFLEDSALDTERCPNSRSLSWFSSVPSI